MRERMPFALCTYYIFAEAVNESGKAGTVAGARIIRNIYTKDSSGRFRYEIFKNNPQKVLEILSVRW
jgi:hypothetical protein